MSHEEKHDEQFEHANDPEKAHQLVLQGTQVHTVRIERAVKLPGTTARMTPGELHSLTESVLLTCSFPITVLMLSRLEFLNIQKMRKIRMTRSKAMRTTFVLLGST